MVDIDISKCEFEFDGARIIFLSGIQKLAEIARRILASIINDDYMVYKVAKRFMGNLPGTLAGRNGSRVSQLSRTMASEAPEHTSTKPPTVVRNRIISTSLSTFRYCRTRA